MTTAFDLIPPWIAFAVTLFALNWIQRWIHRHIFGVGFLLAREKGIATVLYYLMLLPGVILHEGSRYLVAGIFGISPTYITFSPDPKEDGTFELGFVHFESFYNPVHGSIIGIAPLIAGLLVITLIGGPVLHIQDFINTFASGDINLIGTAFGKLLSQQDFLLWSYILFGVANTMVPGEEDRRGWLMIGAVFLGFVAVFLIVGLYQSVINLFAGPVTKILLSLSGIFGVVIFVDLIAASGLWVIEALLSRATNQRIQYRPELPAAVRKSATVPTSVFKLQLPLPAPPKAGAPSRLPPPRSTPQPAISAPQSAPGKPLDQPAPRSPLPAGRPESPSLPAAKPALLGQSPAEPLKPAAPTPGLTPGAPKPLTPGPISGPPALVPRPSGTPAPIDPNRSGPPGRPAFGLPPNPLSSPKKPFDVGNDYIDADVVDDDADAKDNKTSKGDNKDKDDDPGSLKYVDVDEA